MTKRYSDSEGRPAIAIVGMACRYPDANSPTELIENAIALRRAFRQCDGTASDRPLLARGLRTVLQAPPQVGVLRTIHSIVSGLECRGGSMLRPI